MIDVVLERAKTLSARMLVHGIGVDVTALSLAELWGVYSFLRRLATA